MQTLSGTKERRKELERSQTVQSGRKDPDAGRAADATTDTFVSVKYKENH